jgi:TonB family protein
MRSPSVSTAARGFFFAGALRIRFMGDAPAGVCGVSHAGAVPLPGHEALEKCEGGSFQPRERVSPALVARWLLILVVFSTTAWGFEEATRRTEVDGGVHVPVLTKAPALKTFVEAEYPAEAQAKGLQASVRLSVTVGADGSVTAATVKTPVGDGFDEAAQAAVRQFIFTPAEVDFTPAPVQIEYVYHFVLQVVDAGVVTVDEVPDAGAAPGESGRQAHLTGTLIARGSRTRIEGAVVSCEGQPAEVVSDVEGRFDLEVAAGTCQVRIQAAEYETYKTAETLRPGETTEVKYFVQAKLVGYQTVVKGQKEKKEVVRRSFSRQELQKIPGSFGDPIRVIQNFPGVARAPFISGQLIVRGANPNQTLTFFDGVEIPILFHLGAGPSVVNAEFLDKVDFYPGGFGARYGRAVGGAIDVTSRKGAADTLHGVVKIDLQDSSVFLEGPLADGVSLAAAARRSYIDLLLPLVLPRNANGGSLLVLPAYWDYQLRLDVGSKRGESSEGKSLFSLFAFGSDDQLKLVATGGGTNRDVQVNFQTTFHRFIGGWSYKKGAVQTKLTPYLGLDLANVDLGAAKLIADRYTIGLREDLSVDATSWLTMRVGGDIYNSTLVGEAELPVISGTQFVGFPGAEPKAESQRVRQVLGSFDGALYAEADFKLWKFTVTPGIRGSTAFLNGETRSAVDPRLWLRFDPWDKTSVKGSVGLYTQPPNVVNMVQAPFGTNTLTHERAFQASLGVSQKFSDYINVDVTGFFNRRFENVVSGGPTTNNADGTVTTTAFSNSGLGRAYGMEVMLRHEVSKHFFGWVAYTLSRSEERRAGTTQDYRLTSFDQTHILTAIGSVRLPAGFEVGARFRYVTGRPRTALRHQSDLYSADSNRFSGQFGDFRADRVRDFHQLDIRIDKYFQFESWTLNLFLDVQNVYNQMNAEQFFFDYRFRQEFEVPGIPILPILGAKASF